MAVEPRVLQRDDLLRAAMSAGFGAMTERRLEDFRQDGLMPRPVRVGNDGRQPVWIYPLGSDQQLVRLLRWREHTQNVDVLRVVLWIEGFPLALDAVRASATAVLTRLLHEVEQDLQAEASRQGLDPVAEQDAVVSAVAMTMAAKRGKNALPRPIRVPAGERATAVAHLLQIFALGKQPNVTEEEAETIEKVLGVSPGRRQRVEDVDPWLTGPASALVGAADFVSLPRMAGALADATDSEWEEARSPAAALFLQLPVVTRAIAAMTGKENFAGMGGHIALDSEPIMAVFLVAFALGARRADWSGNVEGLSDSLAPWPALVGEMKQVLDMPQHELDHNLAGHGPEMRDRTQRIIKALLEGELDPGPRPTC
ncbi:hypothetical protein ACH4S8_08555 [Streptomyces sp. NPDC021080]|uniref:hypothetical protein n=1 Tax=Streptomyces sp. NPDC021080 TaxID=3365110 RepID=UPI0037B0B8E4